MALRAIDFLQRSSLQETICVGMFYLYHIEYKFIWTHEIVVVSLWIRCVGKTNILQNSTEVCFERFGALPVTRWKRTDYVEINILAYSNENP